MQDMALAYWISQQQDHGAVHSRDFPRKSLTMGLISANKWGHQQTRLLRFTFGHGGGYQERTQSKCRSWLQAGWSQQKDLAGASIAHCQERGSHFTGLCNKTRDSPAGWAHFEKKLGQLTSTQTFKEEFWLQKAQSNNFFFYVIFFPALYQR